MIALWLGVLLSQAPQPPLTVTSRVEIEGRQHVGDREVQLERLTVSEAPAEVLSRYARTFEAAGWFIPPPDAQVQLYRARTSLTALEPKTMTSCTVTVWKAEGPGTQVLIGHSVVAPAPAAVDGARTLIPPGASGVFRTSDEGHATYSFQPLELPAELRRVMGAQAEKAGYRLGPASDDRWQFDRGAEHVEVHAWREANQTQATITVSGLPR